MPPLQLTAARSRTGFSAVLWIFLLALALGATIRYIIPATLLDAVRGPSLDSVRGAAILLAATAASIVLHEGGHLAAALLVNFEILSVALGPFRVMRCNGFWTLRFSVKSFFSGSVSAVPRNVESWRRRMLIVVAGGPTATLITGLLAVTILLSRSTHALSPTFLGALAQLSLLIFVLGLIPNSPSASARNDARLLSVLLRDAGDAREILLYHVLTRLEMDGVRPKDYPESLMHELSGQQGRPDLMLFSAHKIVLWALDRGQLATVDAWDRRCLDLSEFCLSGSRNLALAHSAFLDVLVRNQVGQATKKFADVEWDLLSPPCFSHRVKAAYAFSRGDIPECLAEISRAQHAFPNKLPVYTFERNLLGQLHRKALSVSPPDLAKHCAA